MKYLLIIALLMPLSFFGKESVAKILNQSFKCISARQYARYNATYKIKFLNQTDTNIFTSFTCLYKIPSDTILKCEFWYTIGDSFCFLYNSLHLYEVNKKKRQITIYNPEEAASYVNGSAASNVIWKDFLEPDLLKKLQAKENT